MDGVSAGLDGAGQGQPGSRSAPPLKGDQDALVFELQILRETGGVEELRVHLRPEARGAQINHLTRKSQRSVAGVT